jgi:TPR repeat protein
MTFLGEMYANGRGVDQNNATAKRYYEKGMEKKNAQAIAGLGMLYKVRALRIDAVCSHCDLAVGAGAHPFAPTTSRLGKVLRKARSGHSNFSSRRRIWRTRKGTSALHINTTTVSEHSEIIARPFGTVAEPSPSSALGTLVNSHLQNAARAYLNSAACLAGTIHSRLSKAMFWQCTHSG